MDGTLFRFIIRHSAWQQSAIVALTLLSFPFLYLSLELPKWIINDAIAGSDFPKEFLGVQFAQVPYLMLLSGLFLALVVANGLFKLRINTMKGRLGEQLLRRLRYELYARVLRFPLPTFRKVSAGEIIPMITAEVEPIGGFAGDSIALPVFQGGTLLVYLAFIFAQDPVLGAAAVALYPFQGWLIPRLQNRVNQLGKRRVRAMRQIADRIGETVAGVQDIHANDTAHWHLADIAHQYGNVYDIRFEIYQRKFFIKFLNSFINQLTPFFFYSIGGYLVIRGSLSFGALVAVLAAYKDLASPWKELLTYYQQLEDVRIKYDQVIQQFDPPDLLPAQQPDAGAIPAEGLRGPLSFRNVTYGEAGGPNVLEGITCSMPLDRHTAVLGDAGTDEFALLAARLLMPTSGRILLGDTDVTTLPESVTGQRIAYVGANSTLLSGSLRYNLLYGLRHRPVRPAVYDERGAARERRRAAEALAAGNTDFDIAADWYDYGAAGCETAEQFSRHLLDVLGIVDFVEDVYGFGLHGTIDPSRHPDLARQLLAARAVMREKLRDPGLGALVELFASDRFNKNATVAENLLFGTPVGPVFSPENMAGNAHVLRTLETVGLTQPFLDIGVQVASTMVELFAELPPEHEFFEQFSFIRSDDLPTYQAIVARVQKSGFGALGSEDRRLIMELPFKLVPARDRLGLVDDALQARILEARAVFARTLPQNLRDAVEFFAADRYNRQATIQENILLGRLVSGTAHVRTKVTQMIGSVLEDLNLREAIVEVGLDVPVGIAGSRLSAPQRQKVALARALLKNPDLIVINQATAWMDGESQRRLHTRLLDACRGRGVLWVVHRPTMAHAFDQVLVLRAGRIAEQGTLEDLDRSGTIFRELTAAE